MKSKTNLLLGLFFILLGVSFAGKAFGLWHFNIFFRGWWTLFLIIPCGISILQNGFRAGSVIGLGIGLLLFLSQYGIISSYVIGKLLIPLILVVIGISIILQNTINKPKTMHYVDYEDNTTYENYEFHSSDCTAIFSGQNMSFNHEPFTGANLNAIFGSITLDLRDAIINSDVEIVCSTIFGGIDIYVSPNVNIKVSATPIFGGVDNKRKEYIPGAPTIYINATCMFGGVDIK